MTIQLNSRELVERTLGNEEPVGAQLLDNDGAAVNLTGLTVTCDWYDLSDGSQIVTDGSCNLDDAANGKVSYSPATADVGTARTVAIYFKDDSNPVRQWPHDGAKFQLKIVSRTTG